MIVVLNLPKTIQELTGKFPKLGTGSSREVYAVNDEWVVKVPLTEAGEKQNETEFNVFKATEGTKYRDILCPCTIVSVENAKVLVMKRTEPVFEQVVSKSLLEANKELPLEDIVVNDEEFTAQEVFLDDIFEDDYSQWLWEIEKEYDVCFSDMIRMSSWGYLKGKLFLYDYGLTNAIYYDYYASEEDKELLKQYLEEI